MKVHFARAILTACLALGFASPSADAATVRIGVSSLPPQNGNPFASPARTTWYTGRAYMDMLTQLGEGTKPEPALALSWTSTDPTTWIVKLRPKVTFSNGEPFDAAAVVFTYEYLKTPEAQVDAIAREADGIVSVRAIDPLTVEFKTKIPDPGFARQLSVTPIIPPGYWKKVGKDGFLLAPVGTGSFKVEKWEKNRVVFTASKGSWRAPKVDGLEIIALPETTTRIQALLSGRIDIALEIGAEDVDAVTAAGFKTYQRPGTSVHVIAFNQLLDGSPFKDVRVRQALNYGVNKQAIVDAFAHGLVPPATQTAARGNAEYDPTLKGYPYDPAKAKALLAEAGYGKGKDLTFEMAFSAGTSGKDWEAALQQTATDLEKIGVHVVLRSLPWSQWVRGVQQGEWTGQAFGFEYETLPTGDLLRPYRLYTCTWAHPWYCDKEIVPLVDEAKSTFSAERRKQLIKQILARTNEQAPTLLMYEPLGLDAISPKIDGYDQLNAIIPFARISVKN